MLPPAGFPHSDIQGSKPACGSPWLIAACHVLPRLSAPRHPPCALTALDQIQFNDSTKLQAPSSKKYLGAWHLALGPALQRTSPPRLTFYLIVLARACSSFPHPNCQIAYRRLLFSRRAEKDNGYVLPVKASEASYGWPQGASRQYGFEASPGPQGRPRITPRKVSVNCLRGRVLSARDRGAPGILGTGVTGIGGGVRWNRPG